MRLWKFTTQFLESGTLECCDVFAFFTSSVVTTLRFLEETRVNDLYHQRCLTLKYDVFIHLFPPDWPRLMWAPTCELPPNKHTLKIAPPSLCGRHKMLSSLYIKTVLWTMGSSEPFTTAHKELFISLSLLCHLSLVLTSHIYQPFFLFYKRISPRAAYY